MISSPVKIVLGPLPFEAELSYLNEEGDDDSINKSLPSSGWVRASTLKLSLFNVQT